MHDGVLVGQALERPSPRKVWLKLLTLLISPLYVIRPFIETGAQYREAKRSCSVGKLVRVGADIVSVTVPLQYGLATPLMTFSVLFAPVPQVVAGPVSTSKPSETGDPL